MCLIGRGLGCETERGSGGRYYTTVETRTVRIDSVELWAERIGRDGRPVLFLAGATMQAIAWPGKTRSSSRF